MPLRLVSHTHIWTHAAVYMHIDIHMCVDVHTHVYVRERKGERYKHIFEN